MNAGLWAKAHSAARAILNFIIPSITKREFHEAKTRRR
jgi:hypothetical protein